MKPDLKISVNARFRRPDNQPPLGLIRRVQSMYEILWDDRRFHHDGRRGERPFFLFTASSELGILLRADFRRCSGMNGFDIWAEDAAGEELVQDQYTIDRTVWPVADTSDSELSSLSGDDDDDDV